LIAGGSQAAQVLDVVDVASRFEFTAISGPSSINHLKKKIFTE